MDDYSQIIFIVLCEYGMAASSFTKGPIMRDGISEEEKYRLWSIFENTACLYYCQV